MKKRIIGVVALLMLLVLPFVKVNAGTIGVVASKVTSSGSFSTTNSTYIPETKGFDGGFKLEQTDETLHLFVNAVDADIAGDGKTVINGVINFSNSSYSISSIKAVNDNYVVTSNISGNSATFSVTIKKAISKEKFARVATVEISNNGATSADECVVTLEVSPGEAPVTPKCKADEKNGVYYDNNGNQVTKEEYDKACTSENPQTGSAVSYVIIVGGILLAGAAFFMTKKSKLYNV